VLTYDDGSRVEGVFRGEERPVAQDQGVHRSVKAER